MRYSAVYAARSACAALCLVAFATAYAQDYPSKPIKVIVSFPPGNSADMIARTMSDKLAQRLGQALVVENHGGAGGIIGMEQLARSAPDGYAIGITSLSPISIIPAVNKKLRYDPVRDLQPIALLAEGPMVLVAKKSLAPDTVADLIAYVKANPGKLSYGSLGTGTISQLTMEMFKQATGTNIVEISYKGSAQALTDVVAGHLDLFFDNPASAVPQIKAGRVKVIATSRKKREASLPDVPTLEESGIAGLKEFYPAGWIGVLAPAGTPAAIVQKLNAEFMQALAAEDVRSRFAAAGLDPVSANSAEQYRDYIQKDLARWSKVARTAKIEVTE